MRWRVRETLSTLCHTTPRSWSPCPLGLRKPRRGEPLMCGGYMTMEVQLPSALARGILILQRILGWCMYACIDIYLYMSVTLRNSVRYTTPFNFPPHVSFTCGIVAALHSATSQVSSRCNSPFHFFSCTSTFTYNVSFTAITTFLQPKTATYAFYHTSGGTNLH